MTATSTNHPGRTSPLGRGSATNLAFGDVPHSKAPGHPRLTYCREVRTKSASFKMAGFPKALRLSQYSEISGPPQDVRFRASRFVRRNTVLHLSVPGHGTPRYRKFRFHLVGSIGREIIPGGRGGSGGEVFLM